MVIVRNGLRRVAKRNSAPDQAKVVSAKSASIGLKQPSKGSLKTVPRPHASEVDGFAVRTTGGKEAETLTYHEPSTLAGLEGIG
jgi:hypothetical protein